MDRKRSILLGLGLAIWLSAVVAGISILRTYSFNPGVAGTPGERWPVASHIPRPPGQFTLVMAIHPHCPCSRASIGELSILMAHSDGMLAAFVVFVQPPGFDENWTKSDIWSSAGAIPGVIRIVDRGAEANLFGAATSGQTMVYDPRGRLRFSGGITAARGHYGDNVGVSTIARLIDTPESGGPVAAVTEQARDRSVDERGLRMPAVCAVLESENGASQMREMSAEPDLTPDVARRASALLDQMRSAIYRRTDKLFAGLFVFQWLAGVAAALLISPKAWAGELSQTHIHVWAAVLLGGTIAIAPIAMVLAMRGRALTRHVVAIAQMLTSGLLIDLTGGRIETHFHYFGSLAFLAFYRDWHVLITASIVAAADHIFRGEYFPQSIYGVAAIQPWRWGEHIGWVVFTDFFLIISIVQSLNEMRAIACDRARLENVNTEIENEVGIRTAELRETARELVAAREAALDASRAKSEFLSSMSHEIRTPMNAILGMAQVLEETPLNRDQQRYLEIMTNNGDALLDLINGILDLARIESGKMSLELAAFDLESVVDRTVETLGIRAHQKGLEMLARVMPGVPTQLIGDRLRVRQVLLNLIGNAVKFTEKGQVMLTVERDRESDQPGHLHFSVADTGIGIAADKLDDVFASFTQADSSTTRQYGGSGLGLAIVRRLVELMGGRAWVESELGRQRLPLYRALPDSDGRARRGHAQP